MLKLFLIALFCLIGTPVIKACNKYYTWQEGDYPYLVAYNNGITLEQFYGMNGNVNKENIY